MATMTKANPEIMRWELHHSEDRILSEKNPKGDATFLRLIKREKYPGSTYLILFKESDDPGVARLSMNILPEQMDDLIAALREFRDRSFA